MDVALVQPRLLAFIAVKFGAIDAHPGALQSGHKVTQGYPSEPTTLV